MKKRNFLFIFLFTGILIFAGGCNNSSSSENTTSSSQVEENIVPIYEGVSFATQDDYVARNLRRKNNDKFDDEKIEESVKSEFGVLSSEELSYYAVKGEKAYITLNFHNPDQFEILSFVLNGTKYQTFQFTEDSTAESITIGVTIPQESGIFEYYIEQIKYIDGNEIKDCKMEGNQSVKIGINYDVTPTTSTDVEVSYTDLKVDTTVVDNSNVVEKTKGKFKIFVFDENNVLIDSQDIKLGKNNAHFKDLEINKNYRYIIACTLDKMDGEGMGFDILEEGDFTTKNYIEVVNKVVSTSSISLDVSNKVENISISEISLYLNDELVETKNSSTVLFDELLSNSEYKLVVRYSYLEEEHVYEEKILTDGIPTPLVNLEVNSSKKTIDYSVGIYDENQIFTLTNVELIKEDIVVESKDSLEGTFENLLSNNVYTVKVNYSYDLNDGHGSINEYVIKEIKTKELNLPTYGFNYSLTDNVVFGNLIINDVDQVSTLTSVNLYRTKDNLLIGTHTSEEFSFETTPNTKYILVVNYTYNLNDGNGVEEGTYSIDIFSSKTAPTFEIKQLSLTSSSMEFDLDINDISLCGQIKNIYLYKDSELISKVSTTNYLLEGLLSNTTYKIVAEYAYDIEDGMGPQVIIEEYEFITLKETPNLTIDEIVSENSIRVIPNIVDKDNSGTITKVELYLNQQLVEIKENEYLFTDLLSNTKYEVKCYYSYNDNVNTKEMVVTKEVTTEEIESPTVDVELSSDKNSVTYKVNAGSALIKSVELLKNNVVINSTNESEGTFENLLSNNVYTVKVNYSYDLNDGHGNKTSSMSKTIETKSFIEPSVAVNTTILTDKEIGGEIIVEDIDNICNIINISLYQNGAMVSTIGGGNNFQFAVHPNVTYQIIVNYEYDLNDGNGVISKHHKVELTSYKELPSVSINAYNITKNAVYYDFYLTDTNNVGYVKSMRLYENNQYIQDLTQYDNQITNLKTNTSYSIVVQYLYDLNDGLGSREITYSYDFKTLKNSPEYYLSATSGTKEIEITHSISDIDNSLTYNYTKVYLNDEVIIECEDIKDILFKNLLSNTLYRIEVGFTCDVNNGPFDYVRSIEVYTQELQSPSVNINANSNETEINFDYQVIDKDKVVVSQEVYLLENLENKVDIVEIDNKFVGLLSDNNYRIVVSLLCDFNDGRGNREITYYYDLKTLALETPSIDLEFESTVDTITYNETVIDNDKVYTFDSIDVYLNDQFIKTVKTLNSKVIDSLESNSVYTFKFNYHYNLNDGKGDIYKTYEENYSTLAHSVEVLGYELMNDLLPKTNEDIVIKVNISNLSKVDVQSAIVNGEEVSIVGGNIQDHVIMVVNSGDVSGQISFKIEKVKYLLNGFLVTQDIESEEEIVVEVISRLNILSIQTIDGSSVYKNGNGYNFVFKIDNPNNYQIKTIKLYYENIYDVVMIDKNHFTLNMYSNNLSSIKVEEITYINENGENAVRKYEQDFRITAAGLDLKEGSYSLVVNSISTPEELLNIKSGNAYELANDIDMSGYVWKQISFNGYFDGKGHTIKNLTMIHEDEYLSSSNASLFDEVDGVFRNVYFENVFINYQTKGTVEVSLFGRDTKGEISNVLISGSASINGPLNAHHSIHGNICIVDDFKTNGIVVHGKTISKETLTEEYKENTLNWVFPEKEYAEYQGFKYIIIDDSYIFIDKYIGTNESIEIPSRIEGKPVVGISDLAFKDCTILESITLNNDIIYYGGEILNGTTSLKEIINFNPEEANLSKLFGNIEFEDSYYIESKKVYLPLSLERIVVDDNLTSLEDHLFHDCSKLTSIELPEGLISIGGEAFYGCSNLTSIELPKTLTKIFWSAFDVCDQLNDVYFKGTIEDWCKIEFENYPSNPMYYGKVLYMLDDNNEWEEVIELVVPSTVTSIGEHQFSNFKITSLIISEGVKSIGSGALDYCSKLKELVIPSTIKNIGSSFVIDCNNLSYIYYRGTKEQWESLNVDTTKEVICEYEYHKTIFNDFASYLLINDKYVYNYKQLDKTITKFDFKELYPNYELRSLHNDAFCDCRQLKELILPEGIEKMPGNMIICGISINYLNIPEGVKEIEEGLGNGAGLDALVIPSTIEKISAIYNVHEAIIFYSKVPPIIDGHIWGNETSCNIYIPKGSLEAYMSIDNQNWQEWVVSKNRLIEKEDFELDIIARKITFNNEFIEYDGNEHSIFIEGDLPEGVSVNYTNNKLTDCGSHVVTATFTKEGCEDVILESLLTIYLKEDLYEGSNYEYEIIGENEIRITNYIGTAEVLDIPSIIKNADDYYLVKEIGNYVFDGNDTLVEVIIHSSIEKIGDHAFYGCNSLIKVTFEGDCPIVGVDIFGVAWDAENFEVYVKEEYYDNYLAIEDELWQSYLVNSNKIKTY